MSYLVLIADDHPLYRDALKIVVAGAFADVECRESRGIGSPLAILRGGPADPLPLPLSVPPGTPPPAPRRPPGDHPPPPRRVSAPQPPPL